MSNSLKAIVRHLVERVGGQITAGKLLGVSTTEISLWGNDNNTRFIPVDHLVDLDAAGGDLFLKHLARQRGYDLVKREEQPNKADDVLRTIGQLARASGDLECTTLEAVSDHDLTPNEERAIRDRIRPVKDSIEALEQSFAH